MTLTEKFKELKKLFKKKEKPTIASKYTQHLGNATDINQLLPFLVHFSRGCNHITEMGVRKVVSTYAFLSNKPSKLIGYDLRRHQNVTECEAMAKAEGLNFKFIEANVLEIEIEPTEFLFIDTYHTAAQLEQELALHSPKVSKRIAFHDTSTFWEKGEQAYSSLGDAKELDCGKGLKYAIEPFLANNPQWKLLFRTEINNGLLIIERV